MSNPNIFQDSSNNSYIIQMNDCQNQPKQSNKDSNITNTPSFFIQTQKNLLNILSSFKFNNKQNSKKINQTQNQQQNSEQNQKTPFSKSQKTQNYSQNRFLQQNFQQNSEKLVKNLIKNLNSPKLLINFLKNYDQEQYKQILNLTPQIVQEIEKVKKLVFYYFNLEKKSEKMLQNLQFNLQENLYGQFIFDKHLPQQVAPIVSKIFENQKILKIQAQLSSLDQYYKIFPVTKNIVDQALCPKVFQIILQQQGEIYREFKVVDLYLGIKEALLKNSPYYKFLKFNNQLITSEQLNACQNFINEVDTYEEIQEFRFPYFVALLFRYLIQEKFIDRNQNNISSIDLFYSECENFPVTNAVLDQINNTTYVTEKGVVGSFRKPKAKFVKQDNQFGSDNQILIGRLFKSQMDQVMNDICLNGSQISREHAQITYKDTLYDGIQPEFFEFLKGNSRKNHYLYKVPNNILRYIFNFYNESNNPILTDLGTVISTYVRIKPKKQIILKQNQMFRFGNFGSFLIFDLYQNFYEFIQNVTNEQNDEIILNKLKFINQTLDIMANLKIIYKNNTYDIGQILEFDQQKLMNHNCLFLVELFGEQNTMNKAYNLFLLIEDQENNTEFFMSPTDTQIKIQTQNIIKINYNLTKQNWNLEEYTESFLKQLLESDSLSTNCKINRILKEISLDFLIENYLKNSYGIWFSVNQFKYDNEKFEISEPFQLQNNDDFRISNYIFNIQKGISNNMFYQQHVDLEHCTIEQNHSDLDQWYFSLLKKTPIYTMYKYVLDRIDYNLPDSCQKDYRFSI